MTVNESGTRAAASSFEGYCRFRGGTRGPAQPV
jgi:hypothetical protein